ncbi:protein EARLY RESPONSIVE TO DEHYDRATION 15-like [Amaranthus tricolor]|uniref:protein EARLY RESPONSIVE TO DEHYDRATION 15-like n=1 Tax=Amaranthus tricolor TaxID=29722 RepID=UPI00258B8DFC|nr:protein EARLY RESPONSIVE TO DEHYDRATION 15-like [Amaranthus tricolor]
MDVLHPQKPPQSSRLNPNAPVFIPMKSYQTIEDFSDQWWELVHSSPFFRDYWLQDCFEDVDDGVFDPSDDLDLPDFDDLFDQDLQNHEMKMEEQKKKGNKDLISMAALKWSESGGRTMEAPRMFEKVPKIVKGVKLSPRTIHQPR